MTEPIITIGVVTQESRKAFWPWTVWNLQRLLAACGNAKLDVEVVWVSDTTETLPAGAWKDFTFAFSDGNVPVKRDRVLAHARGQYLAWVDDDDWQHPKRLVWSLGLLQHAQAPQEAGHLRVVGVGAHRGWFVDLETFGVRPWMNPGYIHPVSFFEDLSVTRRFKFCDELDHPAGVKSTDTRRLFRIQKAGHRVVGLDAGLLHQVWLKHETNMHPMPNTYGRTFSGSFLDVVQDEVEPEDREGLEEQLEALRKRVRKT